MALTTPPTTPDPSHGEAAFNAEVAAYLAWLAVNSNELNQMATAYNLSLSSTSTTSLTVGTGSQSLTVQTGLGFLPGMPVRIASTATPTTFMDGIVSSYTTGTGAIVINVTATSGTGTIASWRVFILPSGSNFASLGANNFTGANTFIDNLFSIFKNGSSTIKGSFDFTALLASRSFSFPDKSGRVALTTDFSAFLQRNRIINGGMTVDQRNAGASQTITAGAALAYTVDRWYAYCTGANVTGQQITAPNAGFFKAYRLTGAASNTGIGFGQRIEAANIADLASSTVTLSAYLASSSLTSITWTAYYANTADTFGTLASPTRTQIATGTFTINATLAQYSAQISLPANAANGVEIVFTGGALLASQTFTIDGVQLEPGSSVNSFEFKGFAREQSDCDRYFQNFGNSMQVTSAASTQQFSMLWRCPMRVAPTITSNAGNNTAVTADIYGWNAVMISSAIVKIATASAEL